MENLAALAPTLRSADPSAALATLQIWCKTTPLHTIRAALIALPEPAKASIASACRDILSQYPRTIWGIPFLFHCKTDDAAEIALVEPRQPESGAVLSLRTVFSAPGLPVSNGLITNRVQCALLKLEGDCTEAPVLDMPALLRLFPEVGQIHVAGAAAWSWPQAVEAGVAMYSSAFDSKAQVPKTAFLSELDWQYALETAVLFRKSLTNAEQNEI